MVFLSKCLNGGSAYIDAPIVVGAQKSSFAATLILILLFLGKSYVFSWYRNSTDRLYWFLGGISMKTVIGDNLIPMPSAMVAKDVSML